jgi:hypothetical protein
MCKPVLFGENDKVTPPDVAEEFNKLLLILPYGSINVVMPQ